MEAAVATSHDTVAALLEGSRRDRLPLRSTFVQRRGADGPSSPGPLASFVRAHHNRALEQYLLVHAVCSGGEFDVARDARVWARALDLGDSPSARAAVSKNWRWLEKQQLIARGRRGRLSLVQLLREDGSGATYGHPATDGDTWYFQLPYEYWLSHERWYRRLDLPASAALLIACTQPAGFSLPLEKAPRWYGISADTLHRGFKSLETFGLVEIRSEKKAAPLSPLGFTQLNRYTLVSPFKHPARKRRDR